MTTTIEICKNLYTQAKEEIVNVQSHIQNCNSRRERLENGLQELEQILTHSDDAALVEIAVKKNFGGVTHNSTDRTIAEQLSVMEELVKTLKVIEEELQATKALTTNKPFTPANPATKTVAPSIRISLTHSSASHKEDIYNLIKAAGTMDTNEILRNLDPKHNDQLDSSQIRNRAFNHLNLHPEIFIKHPGKPCVWELR